MGNELVDISKNIDATAKLKRIAKGLAEELKKAGRESEPILTENEKKELFNKPDYYHKGGIDVLGYLEQHFPTEGTYTVAEGFYIGNIIKYVSRYKGKNKLKDLEKATDYLHLLCEIEKAKPDREPNELDIGTLLTDAYDTDDIFAKNALLLQALNLLEVEGIEK